MLHCKSSKRSNLQRLRLRFIYHNLMRFVFIQARPQDWSFLLFKMCAATTTIINRVKMVIILEWTWLRYTSLVLLILRNLGVSAQSLKVSVSIRVPFYCDDLLVSGAEFRSIIIHALITWVWPNYGARYWWHYISRRHLRSLSQLVQRWLVANNLCCPKNVKLRHKSGFPWDIFIFRWTGEPSSTEKADTNIKDI